MFFIFTPCYLSNNFSITESLKTWHCMHIQRVSTKHTKLRDINCSCPYWEQGLNYHNNKIATLVLEFGRPNSTQKLALELRVALPCIKTIYALSLASVGILTHPFYA